MSLPPSDNGQPDLVDHSIEEILQAVVECIKNSDKHTLKGWLELWKLSPFPAPASLREETPLHVAAAKPEYKECLELLLDYIDSLPIDINLRRRNNDYKTALHIACCNECEENVLLLLQRKCDVDIPSMEHGSELHVAAERENLEIAQYLLDYGANTSIHAGNNPASTPLHIAACRGNVKLARILLENGADARTPDSYCRKLPLHFACQRDHDDMIGFLVEQDSSTVNGQDGSEVTPLMEASKFSRNIRSVRFLHENGASFSCKDSDGRLALHYAAKNRHVEVLQYVLEHTDASSIEQCFEDIPNVLKNERSVDSLICCAIESGNVECMKILLSSNKISTRILQIPRILKQHSYAEVYYHEVYSPLTFLFIDKVDLKSEIFDLYLQLLLEHNLMMLDEFLGTFKKILLIHEDHLLSPFSVDDDDSFIGFPIETWPLCKRLYYINWLNTNGITIDYCLQCYHDNTQLFASFDDYRHYYKPVIQAILDNNVEELNLLMATSAILEPDKLIAQMNMLKIRDNLPNAEPTSQCHVSRKIFFDNGCTNSGEEHCNIYKYLISLKPIFHTHAQLNDSSAENNVWFPCYTPNASREFAESTLKQLCRTTIRHHLRKATLEANLRDFQKNILELPLPPSLKDYLSFKS